MTERTHASRTRPRDRNAALAAGAAGAACAPLALMLAAAVGAVRRRDRAPSARSATSGRASARCLARHVLQTLDGKTLSLAVAARRGRGRQLLGELVRARAAASCPRSTRSMRELAKQGGRVVAVSIDQDRDERPALRPQRTARAAGLPRRPGRPGALRSISTTCRSRWCSTATATIAFTTAGADGGRLAQLGSVTRRLLAAGRRSPSRRPQETADENGDRIDARRARCVACVRRLGARCCSARGAARLRHRARLPARAPRRSASCRFEARRQGGGAPDEVARGARGLDRRRSAARAEDARATEARIRHAPPSPRCCAWRWRGRRGALTTARRDQTAEYADAALHRLGPRGGALGDRRLRAPAAPGTRRSSLHWNNERVVDPRDRRAGRAARRRSTRSPPRAGRSRATRTRTSSRCGTSCRAGCARGRAALDYYVSSRERLPGPAARRAATTATSWTTSSTSRSAPATAGTRSSRSPTTTRRHGAPTRRPRCTGTRSRRGSSRPPRMVRVGRRVQPRRRPPAQPLSQRLRRRRRTCPERHPDHRERRDAFVKLNQYLQQPLEREAQLPLLRRRLGHRLARARHASSASTSPAASSRSYEYRWYTQTRGRLLSRRVRDDRRHRRLPLGRLPHGGAVLAPVRLRARPRSRRRSRRGSPVLRRMGVRLGYERYFNSNNYSANILETGARLTASECSTEGGAHRATHTSCWILGLVLATARPPSRGDVRRARRSRPSWASTPSPRGVAREQLGRDVFANPYATVTISQRRRLRPLPLRRVARASRWSRIRAGTGWCSASAAGASRAYDGRARPLGALRSRADWRSTSASRVYVADTGNDRIVVLQADDRVRRASTLVPLYAIGGLCAPL